MTREEYIKELCKTYRPVTVLSRKTDHKIVRLRHRELGRDLVLHSFPRKFEAYEILCGLHCENLPEVYDTIELEDGQVVLEEFIDGVNVADMMEENHYTYKEAKKVLKPLLFALSVLHEKGLVHRDVKPENVMLGKDKRVVLIDFDASRTVKNANKDTEILGTIGFAPPEQLGLSESDARTDIYAVGVMLNVMLTGVHPSKKIATGKAGKIIRKCTAVSPGDRFRSALHLARVL